MPLNKITITTQVNAGGVTNVPKQQEVLTDLLQRFATDIPAGTTNLQINIAVPLPNNIKFFSIACKKAQGELPDGTVDMLVKTNSTSLPDNFWVVKPTNGVCWSLGDPTANPVTAPIINVFVTNSGTAKAEFSIDVGYDA